MIQLSIQIQSPLHLFITINNLSNVINKFILTKKHIRYAFARSNNKLHGYLLPKRTGSVRVVDSMIYFR